MRQRGDIESILAYARLNASWAPLRGPWAADERCNAKYDVPNGLEARGLGLLLLGLGAELLFLLLSRFAASVGGALPVLSWRNEEKAKRTKT